MSSGLSIQVQGFEELKRKIILLSNDKDKRSEVIAILRQVAKPTLSAAKILAPVSKKTHVARGVKVDPGNLRKSLGIIASKSENPMVLVGARAKGSNKGWYAHFVHEGVNIYNKGFKRKRVKGANSSAAKSRTASNPFLRKAYEVTKSGVTADAERKMAAFLQRRIDKLL
jgi:hypothetical protein